MSPATQSCERCGGSGRTPRARRRRADGSPDPFDILGQHSEICDKCGGCGEVSAASPHVAERKPGYAADLT
jgi:hypothetical protein